MARVILCRSDQFRRGMGSRRRKERSRWVPSWTQPGLRPSRGALRTAGAIGGCLLLLAACGSNSSSANSSSAATSPPASNASAGSSGSASAKSAPLSPVVVGGDTSLSGDFSAEGVAYAQGYKLWAKEVNAHGGLLGHPVKLVLTSDASSQQQATSNYTKLITVNHAQLLLGPESTILTLPAAKVAERFGYALPEGSGGGPVIWSSHFNNVFDTGITVANSAVPFAKWIASLPASERPKTVAYASESDPFTLPVIQGVQSTLKAAGLKTVLNIQFPEEVADYSSIASEIAAKNAQVLFLGTGAVQDLSAFVHDFAQAGYNPEIIYAANGVNNGAQSIDAIGKNLDGIVTTGSWWPKFDNSLSKQMIQAYLQTYGGSAGTINPGVAEAYSVGEALQQAVNATHSFNNQKIINYLHSGATFNTVVGPVSFNSLGQNVKADAFMFEWQGLDFEEVLPQQPAGAKLEFPKPKFSS